MKIAKKSLSIFLSLLMIFSACSVGLSGVITASAATGEPDYTSAEVDALVKAAASKGSAQSSKDDKYSYTGDDGSVIAAAEAIYNYTVNMYRTGKSATDTANASDTLYNAFMAEFKYAESSAEGKFVKSILYPDGTAVYGYENKLSGKYTYEKSDTNFGSAGTDVSDTVTVENYSDSFNKNVSQSIVTKTAYVELDMETYLKTFASLDDIPSTIIKSVQYSYAHTYSTSAVVKTQTTNPGGTCSSDTYTGEITTYIWNYMSGKPVRTVVKDKTTKKQLLSIEKFFTAERLATTFDDMLELSLSELETYYNTALSYYDLITENFTKTIIDHFKLNYDGIVKFMDNLEKAYRIAAGKYSIDVLLDYIGSEYNEDSYAEMSALYSKVNTAYNVVDTMKSSVAEYIVANGYAEKYAKVQDMMDDAKSYIATLHDIMTEQRLEEQVDSMVATYKEYYSQLDKNDLETPTDAEIVGLLQKVESYNSVLSLYTSKSYYRDYWSTDYEAAWADFCAKLDDVASVRDIKISFNTYYKYFMPLLFTTQIADLTDDKALDLHKNFQTNVDNLIQSYNDCVAAWGETIAKKIFTINYGGKDWLLQDLVVTLSQKELEDSLVARTEAKLDAVAVYSGVTEVNFYNFAEIKSTLTHFDYDLYNYVVDNNLGLSDEYKAIYSQVESLLEKYHAFSKDGNGGYDYFDHNFTFADENGLYATRYAGDQLVEVTDEDGETGYKQIGYPNDIARDSEDNDGDGKADDNYYVTEAELLNTVVKIDSFITSRDFGAIIGLEDEETEEATDLKTYVNQLLANLLYTDDMMNTLVGLIFPMLVNLINEQLLSVDGALKDIACEPSDSNATIAIDLAKAVDNMSGTANLYLDDDMYDGAVRQKALSQVFAEVGLYIYPETLADSLAASNPAGYGVGSDIYTALKNAGSDWTVLVNDETSLNLTWGVSDEESFLEAVACVLDSILPILQAALAGNAYSESVDNAAYGYVPKLTYYISISNVTADASLSLDIEPLTLYADLIVPLFEVLGIEKIPTLKADCSAEDIVDAIFGTLLDWIDGVLDAPLSTILDILPNLVYFLSMDSIQEIIDSTKIVLNIAFELDNIEAGNSSFLSSIVNALRSVFNNYLKFDLDLDLGELIDLYDLLGFEITNFNEILEYVLDMTNLGIELPKLKQEEIIFCSTWGYNSNGRVDLEANKGDIIYWFLDYLVSAIADGSLLDSLLGDDMDATLKSLIDKVVYQISRNQDGALAAIIELLNPVEYELEEMDWIVTETDSEIEGASQMSIVYLNYGNDWTREDANYVVDNIDDIVYSVLDLLKVDIDNLGEYLADMINGVWTNKNITAIVKMLGSLGDSPSAVILDVVENQVGISLAAWFDAFGYLFPADTWKDDAEVYKPGDRQYTNVFDVTGELNEDGSITWSYKDKALVDGDGDVFIDIICSLISEADLLIGFLFGGQAISAFGELLTVRGYDTYDTTLGLILTMLGVEGIATQAEFTADATAALSKTLHATLNWLNKLLKSENMMKTVLELLPDLFYYVESNGLSTLLHNRLMPVLVIVDVVRPLIDVDINGVLSLIVSDLLNYGTIDLNVILQYVIDGVYVNDDWDYKFVSIDINNITFAEIIKIADKFIGTNLYESGLVQIGIKGICSDAELVENTAVGDIYRPTISAADTITIILTAVIDCLSYETASGKANGDVICEFIADMTGNEDIAGLYPTIAAVLEGIELEYTEPNWGYMFTDSNLFDVTLPEHSIVYLTYKNNWTQEAANKTYDALDEVLDIVLESVLDEGTSLESLINGLLEGDVYTDANLTAIVELLVNLLADFDETLRDLVDCVVSTDIAAWFKFCKEVTDEETGETKWVCTYDWKVDEAETIEAKQEAFLDGLKAVLEPANELLSWLFFGTDYAFFTGSDIITDDEIETETDSETDSEIDSEIAIVSETEIDSEPETDAETKEEIKYAYNDLITLNGGEGYARGLVPILEALGLEMQPAAAFYDAETDTYDVGEAVSGIVDSLLNFVDDVLEAPIDEVFELIPNLIYFINADGLVSSVNNLLAPVDGILKKLTPLVGDISIGGLLEDTIGLNISNLTMDTLLEFANEYVQLSEDIVMLIKTFYIGELSAYTSANGLTAYRMTYTDKESAGDMLTIILSLVFDLFVINEELFSGFMGEDIYKAVMDVLSIEKAKAMQDYGWLYTDKADTDYVFNATETSVRYEAAYNNIWTRDKAQYIADNLPDFISDILGLIGMEINGVEIKTLDDLLDSLLEGNLYTQEMADTILDLLKSIPELLGDYAELGTAAIDIIDSAIGTSIGSWADMTVEVDDGDRDSFVSALKQMLAPIVPLLDVLLCGEDLSFFYHIDKTEVLTIPGSEGYAYGIVPLFEALGCTMMTPEEFYALDDEAKIGAILDSLLDRVDVILTDPVNEIFAMLPELIYFINSNGLDTAVNNILNSVDTVLEALAPILDGKTSLMKLLGVDLSEFNFDYLVNMACEAIEDSTGLEVEALIVDFVSELTMGKVVSYTSANGATYYKMVYAGESQFADMITVLLRLIIDFLATGNNADAIIALIAGNSESEDAANSANTLIHFMLTALNTEPVTSGAMATLYWIFYGLEHGADGLDYLYGNYGESWNAIVDFFEESDESYVNKAANVLKAILKEFAGIDTDSSVEHCDCNCHSKSAFIRFFFKFANFFRRIFGMTQYRYCDCGEAHW